MRSIAVVLLFLALMAGCRRDQRAAIESKCDASLRQIAQQLASTAPDSLLDVMGQATASLDDARKQKLSSAGAQLGTVTGDLFTARVAVKKLGSVAVLDFVKSLALSQTNQPLGH